MEEWEEGGGVCRHFPDDPNAVCTVCKPKVKADPWQFSDQTAAFESRFRGTCANCGGRIEEGEMIWKDGPDYCHVECP